jgi:pimeloyl-ACP methyl ester carboxylesterase
MQALFRPSVQPYLISWFKYDPAVEIAKIRVPTAIVGGGADVQVPVADARLLKAAAPAAKLVIADAMSHVLKDVAGTGQAQQLPAYTDPALPIDRMLVETVAEIAHRSA